MKKLFSYYRKLFTDTKDWLLLALILFLIGCVIGMVVGMIKPDLVIDFLKEFKKHHLNDPRGGWPGVKSIFLHNFDGSVESLLMGVVFGLSPLIDMVVNGFAMGCVFAVTLASTKYSLGFSMLATFTAIAPHGIIELPTVIFSAALGLKIGWAWLRADAEGRRGEVLKTSYIAGVSALPAIALLLFIAALIETFVTPPLIHLVIGPGSLHFVP
jgi:stage II sporulation protein M